MFRLAALILLTAPAALAQDAAPRRLDRSALTPQAAPYADAAERILARALADSAAYERVAELADTHGHRLSGSAALEQTIDDILARMQADGLENVRGQPVMVPVWVRGQESAAIVTDDGEMPLAMLGLGGSVGTPGITAPVLVVSSFEELTARGAEARGQVVVYDVPFTTYGETVAYRVRGASEAARVGAVAALVRSVGPVSLSTPHTGTMRYADDAPRIPSAAITIEGATQLARMQARGETPVVRVSMQAQTLPDRLSRNVVAEIVGRERPDEVVVAGGHIDSWDVGQGAVDDLDGCVVTWEALRVLARPRPASAPDRPRRAVDERGKRDPRRAGVSRLAGDRRVERATGVGERRGRVRASGLRLHRRGGRDRDAARGCRAADRVRCWRPSRPPRSASPRVAAAPTSGR